MVANELRRREYASRYVSEMDQLSASLTCISDEKRSRRFQKGMHGRLEEIGLSFATPRSMASS
jgi:hypothetical protein